jgi:hypothetical protein
MLLVLNTLNAYVPTSACCQSAHFIHDPAPLCSPFPCPLSKKFHKNLTLLLAYRMANQLNAFANLNCPVNMK